MYPQSILSILAFSAVAMAQWGGSGGKTTTAAASQASPTSTSSGSTVHSVMVGQGGLVFTPSSITAAMGDQVEFHFASAGHSVAEGVFSNACQPSGASAFFSGTQSSGGEPWTITINSTDPVWYYCATQGHCQAGMVGVINPPSSETVQDFAKEAGKTSSSKAPAQVQGGVLGAAKSGSSSSTPASSSSAASPSQTTSGAASSGMMTMSYVSVTLAVGIFAYFLL